MIMVYNWQNSPDNNKNNQGVKVATLALVGTALFLSLGMCSKNQDVSSLEKKVSISSSMTNNGGIIGGSNYSLIANSATMLEGFDSVNVDIGFGLKKYEMRVLENNYGVFLDQNSRMAYGVGYVANHLAAKIQPDQGAQGVCPGKKEDIRKTYQFADKMGASLGVENPQGNVANSQEFFKNLDDILLGLSEK